MAHKTDEQIVQSTHNLSRFFVENRQIAWVLLIATVLWGYFGYRRMPQRKDPVIPVLTSSVAVPWPGASATKVEQLVTRRIEEAVAQNAQVSKIESISRDGLAVVYVSLDEYGNADTDKAFNDVAQKLQNIRDLPQGAGPVIYNKDFGDTAALMLTVASPRVSDAEIAVRADTVREALTRLRGSDSSPSRFSIVVVYPLSVSPDIIEKPMRLLGNNLEAQGVARSVRTIGQPGFAVIDGISDRTDADLLSAAQLYIRDTLQLSEIHPDAWNPVVIRDLATTRDKLASVAGDQYTYRQLDDFTDRIEKAVKTVTQVSKVSRSGVVPENVFLYYSQERLAAYGLNPSRLKQVLGARNITAPGGKLDMDGRTVTLDPTGEFENVDELNTVALGGGGSGIPVYLRDLVDISRSYQSPPGLLNYYYARKEDGAWRRNRAITLAIQMRDGQQIAAFSDAVNAAIAGVHSQLPSDLILARTSDQPKQVAENVALFMNSLIEAIVLVVVISWIGFWEWRSALLMALSIPITLAMTFGMMSVLGIDVQQVSIATLIIALGLLVDNPVVAGDAIKGAMGRGASRINAAWLGPTRLAVAILFATITNIVAYLPFLLLQGNTGRFIHTLPIVMTCSLVASLIVSRTFLPLLAYYLLRPVPETPLAERRKKGFPALYYRVGGWCIKHRHIAFAASLAFLLVGGLVAGGLKQSFFPADLQYISTVDVFLPEDTPLSTTREYARRAETIVRNVFTEYGKTHHKNQPLVSVTSFVGGGGPRFWFSLSPEAQEPNYAQLIVESSDKHDTGQIVAPLQAALSAGLPGARIDVNQLQTGGGASVPVGVRISGEDIETLRALSQKVQAIYRKTGVAERTRDDWGTEGFRVKLQIDPDRANMAGVTNEDVASAAATGLSGTTVSVLREGDRQIPIVARLRPEERAQSQSLTNLYVYASQGSQRIPIGQVARFVPTLEPVVVRRRNQYRTITVSCFPTAGHLPSEVVKAAQADMDALKRSLPTGYRIETGGEQEDQVKGFTQLSVVLGISIVLIYLALMFQFKNAIKPFIVFAAVPYGMVGSLIALRVMGTPFGFMAFLGMVSLVGVIVSHIIVLFDFIEEAHEAGEPFEQALLDAGLQRLRPILITVLATVIALFPLAIHGGPLWEPLCYAQIGGLCIATVITLILVPVLYTIFVYDLKIVRWESVESLESKE